MRDGEPEPITKFTLTLGAGLLSTPAAGDIEKDTQVVVTVTVPEGKEIESFIVNSIDKKAELKDNKYTFNISENTTITVTFKDVIEPEDPLDVIKNAENEETLKTALIAAEIRNVFSDVSYKANIDAGNPASLGAVQGLVDKTNATWAMTTATFEDNVLTVTVRGGIIPVELEVDNSKDQYEFKVEAKDYTNEELKMLLKLEEFSFEGAKVEFKDNTWTIDFGTDLAITNLLNGIKFYLSVTANDGKVYGSMYNGGYLTSN